MFNILWEMIWSGLDILLFSYITANKKSGHEISKLSHVFTEFLQWFTGFTDAEANFLISFDRNFVRFRFKILLWIRWLRIVINHNKLLRKNEK
jgi:hypothetical protein